DGIRDRNVTGVQTCALPILGRKSDVDEIIHRLQMENYVDRKVQEYSLGMRQRLCFAMMVAADTPIMFMDEVMNGLDPENVSLVRSEERRVGKECRSGWAGAW